ncbi:PIN domain-containing protein [Rubritepida flocculans]|uniref:PIN domain-containing protein n=1 Tax=Rubritepida flocculans TaxID=182403 RepID=UPI0004248AF5|nr:PIN domain-containing protein [Rubritepida flocculans]
MISTFTAFFDANVFYGARLRSLILFLAQTKLFRARWSDRVHEEWIRNLLEKRPDLEPADLARTRELMDASVLDALVTGYEPLIDAMVLPDPDDRHVLAAAVVCKASCIVTFNVADFPPARLAPYGLHAVHPDDFLLDIESMDPTAFADAVREDLGHYRAPPLDLPEYVVALRKAGVPRIAEQIGRLAPILERRPSDRPAD